MRRIMQETFKGLFPMQSMEQMGKQNLALFENAMRMFNPFGKGQPGGVPPAQANGQEPPPSAKGPAAPASKEAAIDDLKRKLDELQGQLAELSKKS